MRRRREILRHLCVCGHVEDGHNLGFFVNGRKCMVIGCPCPDYKYERTVRGKK